MKVTSTGRGRVAVDIAKVAIEAIKDIRKWIGRARNLKLGEATTSAEMIQEVA
jgi:hypothetical protein